MGKVKFEALDGFQDEAYVDGINDDNIEDIAPIEGELAPEEEIESNEEHFYAEGKYNELRDAMQDTDFRLFLINNDLVIPGTLDGDEIKFLDIVGDEDNEEFVLKDAPNDINDVLDFRTLYNIENTEVEIPEDKEVKEAPHEKIVEYILGLKLKDEDTDDVEDDEKEIDQKEKEEEEDENESNE